MTKQKQLTSNQALILGGILGLTGGIVGNMLVSTYFVYFDKTIDVGLMLGLSFFATLLIFVSLFALLHTTNK